MWARYVNIIRRQTCGWQADSLSAAIYLELFKVHDGANDRAGAGTSLKVIWDVVVLLKTCRVRRRRHVSDNPELRAS